MNHPLDPDAIARAREAWDCESFIAVLKYNTRENGGRSSPAASGYRSQVKFDFEEMQTTGRQTFIDKDLVHPGDTVTASIRIISIPYFEHRLEEGMEFEFREGSRITGTGKIVTILNPFLRKSIT